MMKLALKKKWIETLRSRQFKQYTGGGLKFLARKKKNGEEVCHHCCLGVLHEIDGGSWHRKKEYDDTLGNGFYAGTKTAKSANEAFLTGMFARGLDTKTQEELANMNDSGKKFYQIADWIEKHIPAK